MVHHDGGPPSCIAAGFELVSFQFFQKCPNIEMKFQYGALAKTVTVTVTPLNKHFTSKMYHE